MWKIRFLGRILDGENIQKSPAKKNDGRNEEHSPGRIHGLRLNCKHSLQQPLDPASIGAGFEAGHSDDSPAPIERKINAERDQGPKDRSKDSPLTNVEPI